MTAKKGLGAFLVNRRGRLTPAEVDIPTYGRRRVPGLRREEVAVLAGLSGDYYARLEQGRETHPSSQVVEALARALQLDEDARTHLFTLAGAVPDARPSVSRQNVPTALLQMLDGMLTMPAIVTNAALDIVAANSLANALYSPFATTRNLAVMTFLDPSRDEFFVDWRRSAEATVGSLRLAHGTDPRNARLNELVDELVAGSEHFRELWLAHAVHAKAGGTKRLLHPDVGLLDLRYQSLDVRGAEGLQLVVYFPEPGSDTAGALQLLSSLAATATTARPSRPTARRAEVATQVTDVIW